MMNNFGRKMRFVLRNPSRFFSIPLSYLPYFSFLRETSDYQCPITFSNWFWQKVLNIGGNRNVYWPVHWTSKVHDGENIIVGVDAYPGYMQGCYIQGKGGIEIGDYTQIAPNVVIVSSNHDLYDSRKSVSRSVKIGKYCWIAAGVKILPGVCIGDWTIVAAGSVVTRSFPEGYCVVGGVPARVIKSLDQQKCIPFRNEKLYNGYIKNEVFERRMIDLRGKK
jgi:acetyltransferase-like isoleucine patch superfamily enzyme